MKRLLENNLLRAKTVMWVSVLIEQLERLYKFQSMQLIKIYYSFVKRFRFQHLKQKPNTVAFVVGLGDGVIEICFTNFI